MKGTILNFDQQAQSGLISAEDGKRYAFTQNDWKNTSPPKNGLQVDFTAEGDKAHEVYVSSRAPLSASGKKIPAALLAFFLGVFGVHKFYLGYKKQGIIMLLCTIPGIVLWRRWPSSWWGRRRRERSPPILCPPRSWARRHRWPPIR